jgi:hypothetical protein
VFEPPLVELPPVVFEPPEGPAPPLDSDPARPPCALEPLSPPRDEPPFRRSLVPPHDESPSTMSPRLSQAAENLRCVSTIRDSVRGLFSTSQFRRFDFPVIIGYRHTRALGTELSEMLKSFESKFLRILEP